jgi:Uma2 family endonuclease
MASDKVAMTQADFLAFVALPEQFDKRLELIQGEVVDVPANPFASHIAQLIAFYLRLFLHENGLSGYITGEAGGYLIGGDVYVPNVAYTPRLSVQQGFEPIAPLLAVEVISDPNNVKEERALRRKVAVYTSAGVTVWVVNPFERMVEVYRPQGGVELVDERGQLTGDAWLEGFHLALATIFAQE